MMNMMKRGVLMVAVAGLLLSAGARSWGAVIPEDQQRFDQQLKTERRVFEESLKGKSAKELRNLLKEFRVRQEQEKRVFAENQYNLGFSLSQSGKLDEAIEHTRVAVHFNPRFAAAFYNLGYFLSLKGDLDGGIKYTRLAVGFDPKMLNARYNLGYFLQSKGRLDEAAKQYRAAIRLNPNAGPSHYNLGVILTAQKKLKEASLHCSKAKEIVPSLVGPACHIE